MSIAEIEDAIIELSSADVDKLMSWLEEYHDKMWDAQIANDLDAGRLDSLLDEVDAEIGAGMATPL